MWKHNLLKLHILPVLLEKTQTEPMERKEIWGIFSFLCPRFMGLLSQQTRSVPDLAGVVSLSTDFPVFGCMLYFIQIPFTSLMLEKVSQA